jgi:hypothetical protein
MITPYPGPQIHVGENRVSAMHAALKGHLKPLLDDGLGLEPVLLNKHRPPVIVVEEHEKTRVAQQTTAQQAGLNGYKAFHR